MNRYLHYIVALLLAMMMASCSDRPFTVPVIDELGSINANLECSIETIHRAVDYRITYYKAYHLRYEPERALPLWEKAMKVKKYVDALNTYINETKEMLIKEGGGADGNLKNAGNRSAVQNIMIHEGRAKVLKEKIKKTYDSVIVYSEAKEHSEYDIMIAQTNKANWEENNFGHNIPIILALTELIQIQANLESMELGVVKWILPSDNSVGYEGFCQILVVPSSNTVEIGQVYKARIIFHEIDDNYFEMIVDRRNIRMFMDRGIYDTLADSPGIKKWSGMIRKYMRDLTFIECLIPEQTYTVVPVQTQN